ncbi:hypothetical protein NDU88_000104 [Pleurodeles waltl]|uniref:Uncharacterized protein n=1 Tax=Pleurodeles waltl TaxID=8319 RepID=A0AAV7S4Q1_PLEWA|nr:hypothetical protein NDU88_000104 [Pleurodeles waltl]
MGIKQRQAIAHPAKNRGPVAEEIDLKFLLVSRGSGFYSIFFLVQKATGTFQIDMDLKHLNKLVLTLPFKMETLQMIISFVWREHWLVSLVLQDASVMWVPAELGEIEAGACAGHDIHWSEIMNILNRVFLPEARALILQRLKSQTLQDQSLLGRQWLKLQDHMEVSVFIVPWAKLHHCHL